MELFGLLEGLVMRLVKWVAAVIVAYWVDTPSLVKFLVGFMALDFATGLIVGYLHKKLSSTVSFRGLTKKVAILILVTAAHALKAALKLDVDLGGAVATAYIVHESISIVENSALIGVPIPAALLQALVKVKGVEFTDAKRSKRTHVGES